MSNIYEILIIISVIGFQTFSGHIGNKMCIRDSSVTSPSTVDGTPDCLIFNTSWSIPT
ncbi:hypothetical protein A5865_003817 [Enterococcus sp. 12E11_DIV0728]|nr:hypothetical protein A5865_003817 [Enterococcus sp. 12E11_DIV0728]